MENAALLGIVKEKYKVIVLSAFVAAAFSFLGLISSSRSFRVGVDYLIIQKQASFQDFYSLAKSSEYLGKVLSESVYSDRFLDEVIQTGKVSSNMLPLDKKDRLDAWRKMVSVNKTNLEVGLIHVDVLDNDQRTALRTSQAIAQVLAEKNVLFRGGDEQNAEVRVFSGPTTSANPSGKEIALVIILGCIAGAALNVLWIFVKQAKDAMKPLIEQEEVVVDQV